MVFPEAFIKMLEDAAGCSDARIVLDALQKPAGVSVRLNPSKRSDHANLTPVPWSPHAYVLGDSRPIFTLDPLFHAGAFYVQDSSAMFVGHVFRHVLEDFKHICKSRPLRVLDLCAAPGGKTTDLAASLRSCCGDNFILVANEVMKQRASILADNVARWGDPCVVVTSADPSLFAGLEGWFDIIIADVPCSGEGMFRKDASALEQWSTDNVKLCASRQKRILADVWPALAEAGVMIYSTCTFNVHENDGNMEWAAAELGAEHICMDMDVPSGPKPTAHGWCLMPGFVPGEGQYCAGLRKLESGITSLNLSSLKTVTSASSASRRASNHAPAVQLVSEWFNRPMTPSFKGEDTLVALPEVISAEAAHLFSVVRPIMSGCTVGKVKGRDVVPDEDLALSVALRCDAFPSVNLEKADALRFLHKDSLCFPDSPKGFLLLEYEGVPLGFVKNLGNRSNSLHPNGRRIIMDIG